MAKLQSVGSVAGKETVYVDVDDEITAIIDKVSSAKGKVIALVLPKRATVLQSIVNMKLLKRTADNAGKNLVLVSTEAGLMPLAGTVGLFVASTPTSKPSIPPVPAGPGDATEEIDEPLDMSDGGNAGGNDDFDPSAAAAKPVGELVAAGAAGKIAQDDIDDSIDMNDDADDAAPAAAATAASPKPKKDKKLKVPNFDSFRTKIALVVVALIVLIVAGVFALVILPKATIVVATDSSTIPTNLNLTLDTTAKSLDTANDVVPATAQSQQKTSTQQAPATGQQNNGDKATGSVTMSAGSCSGTVPNNISAGTSLSASGHTYILNSTVSFTPTVSHGKCTFTGVDGGGGSSISISALKGGTDYNVSSVSFTVGGRSDVSASGSASGGTDDITKIVTQGDIDGATAKIKADDGSGVKQQLLSALQAKGLQPIESTFLAGTPQVTTSVKAGDATDTVTVTGVTTYTMLGVQKADLKTLVTKNVSGQIDKGKQVILDDGVANASFAAPTPPTATGAAITMEAKSQAGPELDIAKLKTQLAGKKTGDVKSILTQTPGVTNVQVKYSPFWVGSVPKKASKITIQIDKGN